MISRYYPIKPINIPIIQLLFPEVILELEQETTNDILLSAVDSIILTYESISNNKRAKKYPITFIAGGITEPPTKKKRTPNPLKELETDLNPESINPSNKK
jgi:hypothetical protein